MCRPLYNTIYHFFNGEFCIPSNKATQNNQQSGGMGGGLHYNIQNPFFLLESVYIVPKYPA